MVSQVLLMNRSLPDDWLYNKMMLHLPETVGPVKADKVYEVYS